MPGHAGLTIVVDNCLIEACPGHKGKRYPVTFMKLLDAVHHLPVSQKEASCSELGSGGLEQPANNSVAMTVAVGNLMCASLSWT